MHELDKRICVERRVANSRRLHFNRLGDWRPRLIVWPEYNGWSKDELPEVSGVSVDRATDQQWGSIIATAIERFAGQLAGHVTAFECLPPTLWQRLALRDPTPCWTRSDGIGVDAAYVNQRQDVGHHDPVFLITGSESLDGVPDSIRAPLLDRTNLLPFGIAILDFGIEEAVLEISFAEDEQVFLNTLEQAAAEFGHPMVRTDKHFVSHWVIANSTQYGADWREF